MATTHPDPRARLAAQPPLWGAAGLRAQALAATLTDAQVAELWQVLLAFDDRVLNTATDREDRLWLAIEAHAPGLGPLWRLLRAHLLQERGVVAECVDLEDGQTCALAEQVGWDG